MSEFNQSKYVNQYIKDKYDTIKVQLPKGQKESIASFVSKCDTSMNSYIKMLIEEDMKTNEEQRMKRLKAYMNAFIEINESKKRTLINN